MSGVDLTIKDSSGDSLTLRSWGQSDIEPDVIGDIAFTSRIAPERTVWLTLEDAEELLGGLRELIDGSGR